MEYRQSKGELLVISNMDSKFCEKWVLDLPCTSIYAPTGTGLQHMNEFGEVQ